MPIGDRDYVRGQHPPTCTCKECTEKRLGKFKSRKLDKRNRDSQKTEPAISKGTNLFIPQKTKSLSIQATAPMRFLRKTWRKIPLSIHKLLLSLIIIAGLVDIIRRGYLLFTQRNDPIKNTIIFLVEIGLWFWIATVLRSRRYRYRKPKFKIILVSVAAVVLVCAFAGIEPLSSYKDSLFDSISNYFEKQKAARETEQLVAEQDRIEAEALATVEAERKAEEEKQQEQQIIAKLYQLIYQLINIERENQGLTLLQVSSTLTDLAEEHSQEMVSYDYFSHDRMPDSRPFDWNLRPGFGRGENIFMMPQQLVIPGRRLDPEELANEIVKGWIESPGHRENILTRYFTHTGIGIAKSGSYYYITQIFEGHW